MSLVHELAPPSASAFCHASGALGLDRARVMAVVNVTPDSFSDGGRWIAEASTRPNVSVVVAQCRAWVQAGADILDVGGESTRPGAEPVDETTELARVLPVVHGLREAGIGVPISVDTRHATVAQRALEAGASIVNDISGLADPAMAGVVAARGAGLVVGHLRGSPRTMQDDIHFDRLFEEVADELARSVERARAAGVGQDHIVVDPGIGFGKTTEQSAALVASADFLRARLGFPVLIGASRKRFLAEFANARADERRLASVAAALVAVEHGAAFVRVHDVSETVEALAVARHIGINLAKESP